MTELQPRGWLITYNISGKPHTIFSEHNCVGDYQQFDSTATAEAVYACGPELLAALQNIANSDTVEWDDRTEFEAWAKSGARAAIAKATGEAPIVKTLSEVPASDFCDCNDTPDEEQALNKCKACGGRFP